MALEELQSKTELRSMKLMEASGMAPEIAEQLHDVKVDQVVKKSRRKSRKRQTLVRSKDVDKPAALTETKAMVENDAYKRTRLPAPEKQKKTRRRSRWKKRTALVAGSHEAGDQASQNDLGILMVLQSKGQNVPDNMV